MKQFDLFVGWVLSFQLVCSCCAAQEVFPRPMDTMDWVKSQWAFGGGIWDWWDLGTVQLDRAAGAGDGCFQNFVRFGDCLVSWFLGLGS